MMFSKKIQEALNNFPNIMGHENSKKEAQQNFQPSFDMDPVYRRVESIARLKNNRSKPCTLQCLEEVKPRYFRAVYKDGSHKIVTVFVNSEGQSVGEATVRLINTCSVSSTRQQSASAQSSRSCNRTRPTDKAQPLFAPESLSGGEDSLEGFSASSDTKSLSENECADGKRRKKWYRSPTGGINVGIRPDLTNSGPKPTDSCSSGLTIVLQSLNLVFNQIEFYLSQSSLMHAVLLIQKMSLLQPHAFQVACILSNLGPQVQSLIYLPLTINVTSSVQIIFFKDRKTWTVQNAAHWHTEHQNTAQVWEATFQGAGRLWITWTTVQTQIQTAILHLKVRVPARTFVCSLRQVQLIWCLLSLQWQNKKQTPSKNSYPFLAQVCCP